MHPMPEAELIRCLNLLGRQGVWPVTSAVLEQVVAITFLQASQEISAQTVGNQTPESPAALGVIRGP